MDTKDLENKDLGAFASVESDYLQHGLTKREYIAIEAMNGLLSNDEHIKDDSSYPQTTAEIAVKYADALLSALANER